MGRAFKRDRIKKFEELLNREKSGGDRVKFSDFSGQAEYMSFRRWREKIDRGLEVRQSPPPSPRPQIENREQITSAQNQSVHPATTTQHVQIFDLGNIIPGWDRMSAETRELLSCGFEAARQCRDSSANMQAWKMFARIAVPNVFDEKIAVKSPEQDIANEWKEINEDLPVDAELLEKAMEKIRETARKNVENTMEVEQWE